MSMFCELAKYRHRLPIFISLTAALFFATPPLASADPAWEVAIVFLGADETDDYQRDIDADIFELAKVLPVYNSEAEEKIRLSIYRDFQDKSVTYRVDPFAMRVTVWNDLYFEAPVDGIRVPGEILVRAKEETEAGLFQHSEYMQEFLANAYTAGESRRLLILWGHGLGFQGMKGMRLGPLRELLERSIPARPPLGANESMGMGSEEDNIQTKRKPLDILWFDSCFMGTVEVAYEMKDLATHMIASQEAEFSTGAPLERLYQLEDDTLSTEEVSIILARDFIRSYSFLRGGTQTGAIEKSPATITAIDLAKIPTLVEEILAVRESQKNLRGGLRKELNATAQERNMEMEGLADLVGLMADLRDLEATKDIAVEAINNVIRRVEGFGRANRAREALPITVRAPKGYPKAWLVFGYNEWMYGYEGDWGTLEKLPDGLHPDGFIEGKHGMKWPFKEVSGFMEVYPFTPGRNRFYYYYVDPKTGKRISGEESKLRWVDKEVVEFEAANPENPIRFSAYTQSVGERSERYFGLAIFDPSGRMQPGVRHTRFHEKTKWGSF